MVKQTKTFKKGNVTKKALSAILAASMVMTSSSFVMAAPVEVEAVDVVEDVNAGEESVGAIEYKLDGTFTIAPQTNENYSALANNVLGTDVTVKNADGTTFNTFDLREFVGTTEHKVTITNAAGKEIVLTSSDDLKLPVGTYTITVAGTSVENTGRYTTGSTSGILVINDKTDVPADVTFKQGSNYPFTGEEIKPEIQDVKIGNGPALTEGEDYTVSYKNNVNIAENSSGNSEDGPCVVITFINSYSRRGSIVKGFDIVNTSISAPTVTVKNNNVVYNADVQKPELEVKATVNGKTVVLSENDYTVTAKKIKDAAGTSISSPVDVELDKIKDAGTYTLTIVGTNNYASISTTATYVIKAADFNVDVTIPDVIFNGTVKAASPVVTDKTTGKIVDAADYIVYYYNEATKTYKTSAVESMPGTYGIKIVSANDNYKAGKDIVTTYKIVEAGTGLQGFVDKFGVQLSTETSESSAVTPGSYDADKKYEYNKDGVVPKFVYVNGVVYSKDGIVSGSEGEYAGKFDVVFPEAKDCKGLGTYNIKLVGKGAWANQVVEIPYTVEAKLMTAALNGTNPEDSTTVYVRNGAATVAFGSDVLKDADYALVEGKDYTVKTRKDGDEYVVTVDFIGNYKGRVSSDPKTPVTNTMNLSASAIKAEVKGEYIFSNSPIRPSLDNVVITEEIGGKTRVLQAGYDYELDKTAPHTTGYGTNIDVGKGQIYIKAVTANGLYSGTRTVEFDIKAGETAKDNYVLDTTGLKPVYELNGTAVPANDIKVKTTKGVTLAKDQDYTVKYLYNGKVVTDSVAKAGSVTMEITITATKTVLTASFRVATSFDKVAEVKDIADQAFTGSAVTPTVTIVKKNTAINLVEGTDYVVSYTNNVKQGTATAVIEGIGAYYGTINKTFKIAGQAEQSIAVLAAQARDIQSRTLNSKPTVVKFEAGKAPKTDVTYESSDENVVKVDETGKITYTGLGEATITIKAAETAEYKAAEATMTVKVGLAKPSFTPFSKNNAFTVTSSTVKGAEKFEVEYATKKDFSNSKTKTFATTSAGKIRQVKVSAGDKKTYYVRVRAISGTETSKWSATKTVATK